jgi:HEAT repeat protein
VAELPRFLRAFWIVALLITSGCGASGAAVSSAPRGPLDAPQVEALAFVLRLEDRGVYDEEVLNGLASDAEPEVRARTAVTIGRLGDRSGRDIVRRLVLDSDTSVASAAAFALGLLGDTSAVPLLGELLAPQPAARRPGVAIAAAEALGRIATPEARLALAAFLDSSRRGRRSDARLIAAALAAAGRAGEPRVDIFAPWLQAAEPGIRASAAGGLAQTAAAEGAALLLPLSRDPERRVRTAAARALDGEAGGPATEHHGEARALLWTAVEDSEYQVRIAAIRTLTVWDPDAGLRILRGEEGHGGPHERLAALEALVRHHATHQAVRETMVAVADDGAVPPFLRATAILFLAQSDPVEVRDLLTRRAMDPEWQVRRAAALALQSLGRPATADLTRLARDPDPPVAATALQSLIRVLGRQALPEIRHLLLEQVLSGHPMVRAEALRGMAVLADPSTLPILLDALALSVTDPRPDGALAALEALAALRSAGTTAPERAIFARIPSVLDSEIQSRAADLFGEAAIRAWGSPDASSAYRDRSDYIEMVERWIAPSPSDHRPPVIRIRTGSGDLRVTLDARGSPLESAAFLDLVRHGALDDLHWTAVVPGTFLVASSRMGDSYGVSGYSTREERSALTLETGWLGYRVSGDRQVDLFVAMDDVPLSGGDIRVVGRLAGDMVALERITPGERIISIEEVTEE